MLFPSVSVQGCAIFLSLGSCSLAGFTQQATGQRIGAAQVHHTVDMYEKMTRHEFEARHCRQSDLDNTTLAKKSDSLCCRGCHVCGRCRRVPRTVDVRRLTSLHEGRRRAVGKRRASVEAEGRKSAVQARHRQVEEKLIDSDPSAAAASRGLVDQVLLYYINIAANKSTSSAKRQRLQTEYNACIASNAKCRLLLRRVEAVTPDSEVWQMARQKYGDLVMGHESKDECGNDATNCIVLSFLRALHQAQEEIASKEAPEFVIIGEDDMKLEADFDVHLMAVANELREDDVAMGAALHSTNLEGNRLHQEGSSGRALFDKWPLYPPQRIKIFPPGLGPGFWPGEPVIPDQPLALLLKSARLSQFINLLENRLRSEPWSPLDWMLAHKPFGGNGSLRLVARNGFCQKANPFGATGSDRLEQHDGFDVKKWWAAVVEHVEKHKVANLRRASHST